MPTRASQPWLLDAVTIAASLDVDPVRGLTAREAQERRARFGPNALTSAARIPTWKKFLRQFRSPLVALLLVAMGISTVAWFLEGGHGVPVDALVITVIVLLNAVLGHIQEARAEDAVAALQRMTTATSSVLRDGIVLRIPTAEVVPGDILLLTEGDSVGADARLIETAQLRISEAMLTGESESEHKDPAPLTGVTPLGDRLCMVYKGTAVTQGTGRAIVTATGMETEVGKIARMLAATKATVTPLEREVEHLGKVLGLAVIVIALIVMATAATALGVDTTRDAVAILLLGVSLAVAAVPEGLAAVLSVVLAIGVQRMAKRNAIVKALSSVETLGCASVICSDKTGTLTRGEMTLTRVVTASGALDLAQGAEHLRAAARTEAEAVLRFGSLAGDAVLVEHEGSWMVRGDSTDAAFLVAARTHLGVQEQLRAFERVGAIPFTSDRKRVSTIQRETDRGTLLVTKGAADLLLDRCTHVFDGGSVQLLDAARRTAFREAAELLAADAFRTIAVAYRELDAVPDTEGLDASAVEHSLVFVGLAGIIDPPRPEAAVAVAEARHAGIRILLITGDHPLTAQRIAADLGIVAPGSPVLTGSDLDLLDDAAFRAAVRATSVYARVAPEHKLRIVDALQSDGTVVAMTGDGVNDAPALKSADIGVAMGIAGTDVTKEAAAMVLADDNFASIVAAIREGRRIFDNIKKFLRYLLSSNIGEVLAVLFGVLLAGAIGLTDGDGSVALPLLATQILWINLVTDTLPALAMGVDAETDDVMARPPRAASERVIDRRMWMDVFVTGATMAAVTLLAIDLLLPGGLVAGTASLDVARTAGFTVLVFAQIANAFAARSDRTSALRGAFSNLWLLGAVGIGVALQVLVVHVPLLQTAFGTAALTGGQWALCLGLATVVLAASEVRKLLLRLRGAPR